MGMPLEVGPEMLQDLLERRKQAKAERGLPEGAIPNQDFAKLNFGESELPMGGDIAGAAARRLNEAQMKGMNPASGFNPSMDAISRMAAGTPPPDASQSEATAAMQSEKKFQVQPHVVKPEYSETSRQYGRIMMWLDKAKNGGR